MELKPFKRESVMPLPVAFISTMSKDGIRNIAPYGCIMPVLRPLDLICIATAKRRDTLDNIRDTGEFVVNLAGDEFADKVIPTARAFPADEDEFEIAGLEEKPSKRIRAPGIKGCYAWMECELFKMYEETNYILIMGKVVHLEVADEVYGKDGLCNVNKARPLMMMGADKGMHFCTVEELGKFEPFGAMFPKGKDPLAKMYEENSSP
ncbi:flavin reductase family protein [Methanolobus profundi]|uniref:NADH-FMN oxidoreductase RutF, flavin reductase (DIM6/NTAB) family n=1 Tax=Methanolobus profundi TaxID=487685 RepID=A0A1I4PHT7_9EURY|nr:flavin reductase family protein [Methanolobus profundi]SFM27381.1 NADH-FMN oxidoreductase RutF, flavin reductase (DIM6/NTAB) family [Methanolobus profundi]